VTERDHLLQAIAQTISDYRAGEIPTPDAAHVDRWINQFPAPVQQPILTEMEHVLARTYLTKANVENFITKLITSPNPNLTGANPCAFWGRVHFLNIQGGGNSHRPLSSAPQNRKYVWQAEGLAPHPHPLRPMRPHLHVRNLHRRNRALLVVINES